MAIGKNAPTHNKVDSRSVLHVGETSLMCRRVPGQKTVNPLLWGDVIWEMPPLWTWLQGILLMMM